MWTCPICEFSVKDNPTFPVFCKCGYVDPNGKQELRGFGDWIAKQLRRVGVTSARVASLQFWRRPENRSCNCAKRQQALNDADGRMRIWIRGVYSWIRWAIRRRA